jgi:hypothetical protein
MLESKLGRQATAIVKLQQDMKTAMKGKCRKRLSVLPPRGPTRESKQIKLTYSADTSDLSGGGLDKRKRTENLDYSFGGVSSGFLLKLAKGELRKRGGIFARTWPEWLTVETAFNLELEWICLHYITFVKVISDLYPEVTLFF